MRTAKHETMRSQNASVLFQCLREFGPLTRHELQEKTGLSWGAVSSIVSDFLAMGLLTEKPMQLCHPGRTPFALDINQQSNLLIGMDLHAQGLSCVVTDMRARTIVSSRENIENFCRTGLLEPAARMIEEAILASGVEASKFIGIGVAVQGTVDTANGISLHSPHLPEWNDVPVCEFFQNRLHLPCVLVHDTNAMVLAEKWSGKARSARNLVFIRLDMGLGMSLVVDNSIYTGADGGAGEFGHMVVNPDGPKCTCGNYGCMEAYASGRTILQRAREGKKMGLCDLPLTLNEDNKDLQMIARAAREGSAFEKGLFETMGMYLGVGIANLIIMLNPEIVVIGGDLTAYSDLFLDNVRKVLFHNVWNGSRIQIELSSLGTDAAAVGATLMLAEQVLSDGIARQMGGLLRPIGNREDAQEQ